MLEQSIPPYPQELINMSWVSVAGDIEVESLEVFAQKFDVSFIMDEFPKQPTAEEFHVNRKVKNNSLIF